MRNGVITILTTNIILYEENVKQNKISYVPPLGIEPDRSH